jgi:hypothetical protein
MVLCDEHMFNRKPMSVTKLLFVFLTFSVLICIVPSSIALAPGETMIHYLNESQGFAMEYYQAWSLLEDANGVTLALKDVSVSAGRTQWSSLSDLRSNIVSEVRETCQALADSEYIVTGNRYQVACYLSYERQISVGTLEAYEYVETVGWSNYGIFEKMLFFPRGSGGIYSTHFLARTQDDYRMFEQQADDIMHSFRLVTKTTFDVQGISADRAAMTIDGTRYAGNDLPKTLWLEYRSSHTISVYASVPPATEGTRYTFLQWSDSRSNETSRTIVLTDDIQSSYVAKYRTQYLLTVKSDYGSPQGGGWYASGTNVTISVVSPIFMPGLMGSLGARRTFVMWESSDGKYQSSNQTASVVLQAPMTVVAVWREDYPAVYLVALAAAGAAIAASVVLFLKRRRAGKP